MKDKQRLVVIGNGMAGGRFVEELTDRGGREHFEIVMFGEEPHGNYNRILLSSVVAGSHEVKNIFLNSLEWYQEHGITLHAGVRVDAIDRNRKTVRGANGIEEHYDRLVFATGSKPFVPPIQGLNTETGRFQDGAFVFRTLDDAFQIMKHAGNAHKAVVLGGGLLGLEAARGLLNRGLEVHVVELMPHPMAVQLDPASGDVLRSSLEAMGIHFHLGRSIKSVIGNGKVESVTFSDGGTESCDMLVISAGIRPNIEIARRAGLAVERAIVIGDDLACINDSSIYAIGECAQHRGQTYGLVAPGSEQAKVLADRLSGANSDAVYTGSNTSTTLKVMGIDLVVLGEKEPANDDEVITYADPRRGIYKKLILRDGRLAGAILLGAATIAPRLLRTFHKKEIFAESPTEVGLKEVIAIIRPERWVKTKLKAESLGITAFTHHRVVGRGRQGGLQFLARRGATSGTGVRYLPKRMISWIVPESQVDILVQTIMEANRTGQIGDGKIFVLPLDEMTQIRTDVSDVEVLQEVEV
jgi:nitrite reductase (NADH) large subunit